MTKVDRFISSLTENVNTNASFMGMNISTLLAMLKSMVSEQELEQMIDKAVKVWGNLGETNSSGS